MNIVELTSPDEPALVILAIEGRLDATTADEFARRLSTAIEAGVKAIVLDVSAVEYVNSVGLRTLIVAAKRLAPGHGQIVVCCARPMVHEVFALSGLLSVVTMVATRRAAVESARRLGPTIEH